MSSMDDFFHKEQGFQHPMLRLWASKAQQYPGAQIIVEFHRPREGLAFAQAKLYVSIIDKKTVIEMSEVSWDPNLNEALIERGARAINADNETQRFGFMMRDLTKNAEIRYGDGFFNAVLIHFLKGNSISQIPILAKKLSAVREYKPYMEGNSFQDCVDAIRAVLGYMGGHLANSLNYERRVAEQILAGAVAYYIDERFHISARALLGF